ncbi:MAG TPA: DUF881 domain-containing protein [Candidatus Lustribacter sp.]|nr:DUF881 domain-containing protein [Candidatus Lustribacter sp.]
MAGRDRVDRWLFGYRPSRWSLVVPIVFAVAGGLFATSFTTARGTEIRSIGRDLPNQVRDATRTVEEKTRRVAGLERQIDTFTADLVPSDGQLAAIARQSETLALGAGTRTVKGPGVTVRLDDAPRRLDSLPAGMTADDVVVHQQDVQAVVNALWSGGAEAMMIQDQRVISTSAVRCVGNTLILQGRVYSPPYVIAAIGPREALLASLEASPTVQIYRQYVDAVGLGYDVTSPGSATFPAYAGTVKLQFARVAR